MKNEFGWKNKNTKELMLTKTHEFILKMENGEYAQSLCQKLRITYSWASIITNALRKDGIINSKKRGRIRYLYFTEKGRVVRDCLEKISNILSK